MKNPSETFTKDFKVLKNVQIFVVLLRHKFQVIPKSAGMTHRTPFCKISQKLNEINTFTQSMSSSKQGVD